MLASWTFWQKKLHLCCLLDLVHKKRHLSCLLELVDKKDDICVAKLDFLTKKTTFVLATWASQQKNSTFMLPPWNCGQKWQYLCCLIELDENIRHLCCILHGVCRQKDDICVARLNFLPKKATFVLASWACQQKYKLCAAFLWLWTKIWHFCCLPELLTKRQHWYRVLDQVHKKTIFVLPSWACWQRLHHLCCPAELLDKKGDICVSYLSLLTKRR